MSTPPNRRQYPFSLAVAAGVGTVGLIGLVALASRHPLTGGAAVHAGRGGGFSWLLDVITGWMALAVGFGLVAYLSVLRPAHRRGTLRDSRTYVFWLAALIAVLVELQVRFHIFHHTLATHGQGLSGPPPAPPIQTPAHASGAGTHLPGAVLAALALAGVVAGIALFAGRGPRRWARPGLEQEGDEQQRLTEAVAGAAWASLDDLVAEPDPRRAVIAAYARMERGLRRAGVPRERADTPTEYLTRAFDRLPAGRQEASRLTALYVEARFSQHAVGDRMRSEAIEALRGLALALAEEDRKAVAG